MAVLGEGVLATIPKRQADTMAEREYQSNAAAQLESLFMLSDAIGDYFLPLKKAATCS